MSQEQRTTWCSAGTGPDILIQSGAESRHAVLYTFTKSIGSQGNRILVLRSPSASAEHSKRQSGWRAHKRLPSMLQDAMDAMDAFSIALVGFRLMYRKHHGTTARVRQSRLPL